MYLTIDMGNTATKLVLFEQDELVYSKIVKALSVPETRRIVKRLEPKAIILSTVIKTPEPLLKVLKMQKRFIQLSANTRLPIKNRYETPKTLGKDRLAGIIGAAALFPGRNVLVIDAGTCIKYDFINSKKEYFGGAISPGLNMRYQALHQFTDQLPLLVPEGKPQFVGRNTRDAIRSGVETGIANEIAGFIQLYRKQYKSLKLVITGGDASRFVRTLNLPIFAAPDLVNIGLKEILKFHDAKE